MRFRQNRIRKVNDSSLGGIICSIIFCLMMGLIPLILVLAFLFNKIIPDLKTKSWDDLTGTITSASVTDTGRTRRVSEGNNHYRTVRLYDSVYEYSYENEGRTFTKTVKGTLEGEGSANDFNKKHYLGAPIALKVNPQDRSNVIIKPDYTLEMIFLCLGIPVALGFFIFFCILTPISMVKLKKDAKNPLLIKEKFKGFKKIDFRDVEQETYNDGVEWKQITHITSNNIPYSISKTNSVLYFKRSTKYPMFFFGFMLCMGFFAAIKEEPTFSAIWCGLWLTIACLYFLFGNKGRYFDKLKGFYWKGKAYSSTNELLNNNPTDLTPLSQIKALQVLYYEQYGRDERSLDDITPQYEINLVLRDNRRINVYNERSMKEVFCLADQIADFLDVRVLLDPRINKEQYLAYLR